MSRIFLSSSVDGELIRYVARCLEQAGKVTVFFTVSEAQYRCAAKAGGLARLYLRWRMYVWHPLRILGKMLVLPRGQVWVVTTNPFFAPGLAALAGKWKGHRVVHLLYDLFPDALEEAGFIRRNGLTARILGVFPKWALRKSHATVFLGEGLRAHAEARWGSAHRGHVIPVVLSQTIGEAPVEQSTGDVTIHYGGQLGWMHDAELLAVLLRDFFETAPLDIRRRLHWSFRISGAKAAEFSRVVDGLDVEVGPVLPVMEWRERALETEVGLVTLSKGGAHVCLPSKAYGMMACGMAILAICPGGSDLGRLIKENDLGWVVDTGDASEDRARQRFNSVLAEIAGDPEERLKKRRNAWNFVENENRKDLEEGRWMNILD